MTSKTENRIEQVCENEGVSESVQKRRTKPQAQQATQAQQDTQAHTSTHKHTSTSHTQAWHVPDKQARREWRVGMGRGRRLFSCQVEGSKGGEGEKAVVKA